MQILSLKQNRPGNFRLKPIMNYGEGKTMPHSSRSVKNASFWLLMLHHNKLKEIVGKT